MVSFITEFPLFKSNQPRRTNLIIHSPQTPWRGGPSPTATNMPVHDHALLSNTRLAAHHRLTLLLLLLLFLLLLFLPLLSPPSPHQHDSSPQSLNTGDPVVNHHMLQVTLQGTSRTTTTTTTQTPSFLKPKLKRDNPHPYTRQDRTVPYRTVAPSTTVEPILCPFTLPRSNSPNLKQKKS
jgi:hypothetical protein